jgi:hypothetical protein
MGFHVNPFVLLPRAFPQRTIQTPSERDASLFPSLVEPAIERPRLRAPPFVIPINDHWMTSESQAQPAGPPSDLVPLPLLRRSGPELFHNGPSSSANPLPLMLLAMMSPVPGRSMVKLLYSLNSGILN